MASESLSNLKKQLVSWKSKADTWVTKGEKVAERTINAGLGLASGAALGAARAKWGKGVQKQLFVPGTEVDAPSAIAVVGLAAGVTGFAGKYSDHIASIGSHVGACVLDRMVEAKWKK